MNEVFPFLSTQIDWPRFLTTAKQLLGFNLTQALDSQKLPCEGINALLSTLGTMINPELNYNQILINPGSILNHAFIGYFTVLSIDSLLQLMEETPLNILSADCSIRSFRLVVTTGTLSEWQTAIINGCSSTSSSELRLFLAKCMSHMEAIGLGQLWSKYNKKVLPDTTLILRPK